MSNGINHQSAGDQPGRDAIARSITTVLADLRPVRTLPSDAVLATLFLLIFLGFTFAFGLLLSTAGWDHLSRSQVLIYYPAVLAGAVILSTGLAPQMVPGARRPVSKMWIFVLPLSLVTVAVGVIYPQADMNNFVALGLPCLGLGLLCAAVSGAFLLLLLRRGYLATPLETYITSAVFAGFTGIAVLATHCPQHNWVHVVIWHLGAPVLSGLVALAGWLLRAKSRKQAAEF